MDSFFENEILLVIIIGVLVMLFFSLAFVFFFYTSQRKFQAQKMDAQERELVLRQKLLFSSIKTQEIERERIARELHDEIGSKLNVINLGLHRIKKENNSEIVEDLFSAITSTIKTTRQISYDLLPPTLESFGLSAALEELCENYQKASKIVIDYNINQEEASIEDYQVSLAFYRIAQELMTNSFKHSTADFINLNLWINAQFVKMQFSDNGKGFLFDDPNLKPGLGLQNIESRIRMINATKKMNSKIGEGFFIEITKNLK